MTSQELKEKLIVKINHTQNNNLLEEMYRLVSNEEKDLNVYELSVDQINAVEDAQKQFKNGQFLSGEQAPNLFMKYIDRIKSLPLVTRRVLIISSLVLISFTLLLNVNKFDFRLALMNAILQFIVSFMLSFGFTQFYNKYYSSSYFTWWVRFYLLMIAGTFILMALSASLSIEGNAILK